VLKLLTLLLTKLRINLKTFDAAPKSALFAPSPYPFLVSCHHNTLANAPVLPSLLLALSSDGSTLVSWLNFFSPSRSQIVISFLPELMLAFMITYLLGLVAVELAANRSPKALAIEC